MFLLAMMLLLLNDKLIDGRGKYYLAKGSSGKYYLAKGSFPQNITEDLKDGIASYHNGKARKGGRGEPYKGKSRKKGKRRRKGKDYQEGWLDKCSLNRPGERNQFNVPGCGGWISLHCGGGCLSIHEVFEQ